jgi:hypothetical protein
VKSAAFTLVVLVGCAVAVASAQGPASTFARGSSQQSWQRTELKSVLAKCKTPPPPFGFPIAQNTKPSPPEPPVPPASTAIPGVIAAGQTWKVVWHWEGNNADGPIAGDNGTLLFANNDASNVMRLDPATGLATIVHTDTNTGGALSRSKNGALFLAALRGGQAGDGSAVDTEGRLYVATGSSVDVFSAKGDFLGSIAGPQGLHGTAFGGQDKKTLFGIVFYGDWGTPSARNRVIAIPTLAQGYTGRAK